MIIKVEGYSNVQRAVEIIFTPETKEDRALLGAMAANTAKFIERDSTGQLRLFAKVD